MRSFRRKDLTRSSYSPSCSSFQLKSHLREKFHRRVAMVALHLRQGLRDALQLVGGQWSVESMVTTPVPMYPFRRRSETA